jgi:probable rRNA maturation factor
VTLLYDNETKESFSFQPEEQAKRLIRAVCDFFQCPYECEVSLLLVSEETIRELNKKHRNTDSTTDVLSFPMAEFKTPGEWNDEIFLETRSISPETGELLLGDIIICPQIIKEQAKEYGHSELREFSFLTVHSMLHLCGFDHQDHNERAIMEQKQNEVLNQCRIYR